MLINSGSFTLLQRKINHIRLDCNEMVPNLIEKVPLNVTLFNEILLDPTNVVLNSLPTTPTTVVAAAGDWVGLGLKTTALVFGLLIWLKDCRLIGADTYQSQVKQKKKSHTNQLCYLFTISLFFSAQNTNCNWWHLRCLDLNYFL